MHDARKAWHIGDILTIVTSYVVSPSGWRRDLELEEYLAGRPLSKSDRLRYRPAFQRALLEQYPELETLVGTEGPTDDLLHEWFRRRIAEFGEYLVVRPLPPCHAARTNPL